MGAVGERRIPPPPPDEGPRRGDQQALPDLGRRDRRRGRAPAPRGEYEQNG